MVFVDFLDRRETTATLPTVCMHCQDPPAPCAQVCPTQAILITSDGVVQEANKERCIACENCLHACPFGVPKLDPVERQQYKCNMCYDRVVEGKKPMCATVCPSGAIFYGTHEELAARQRGKPVNVHQFGRQTVRTRVYVVAPPVLELLSVERLPDYEEAVERIEKREG
ncbi:MAG: 4Fe-4S binding protein [Chloroflexi bacterium]|nr:4Fe-4S binding protein [Chloroflexota bacterium]